MNIYRVQISESFIFRTTEPVFLDTLLNDIVPVLIKNQFNTNKVGAELATMTKKFLLEQQLPMNMIDPVLIPTVGTNVKSIKVLVKDKLMIMMDGTHEMLYSFANKILSINAVCNEQTKLFRTKDISDLRVLTTLLREHMPSYISPATTTQGVVNKKHPMGGGNGDAKNTEPISRKVTEYIKQGVLGDKLELKTFGGELINTAEGQVNPLNELIQEQELNGGAVGQ